MNRELENWLEKAELTYGPARAIIAPYVVPSYFETHSILKIIRIIDAIYFQTCWLFVLWCLCCVCISSSQPSRCVSYSLFSDLFHLFRFSIKACILYLFLLVNFIQKTCIHFGAIASRSTTWLCTINC